METKERKLTRLPRELPKELFRSIREFGDPCEVPPVSKQEQEARNRPESKKRIVSLILREVRNRPDVREEDEGQAAQGNPVTTNNFLITRLIRNT
jgi:hypothetical protein